MHKLYKIFIVSSVLSVAHSSGMEEFPNSSKQSFGIECDFALAARKGKSKKFIDKNPHIAHVCIDASEENGRRECYPLLQCMVERDLVDAVRELLQASSAVYINTPTECKKLTPLHLVRSKDMAQLLLEKGAQLEEKDCEGNAALSHVLFNRVSGFMKHYDPFTSSEQHSQQYHELAEYLLQQKADCNVIDAEGNSLLHKAVQERYESYISLLIQYGADTEIKNQDGRTAYDWPVLCLVYPEENLMKPFRQANIIFILRDFLSGLRWGNEKEKYHFCDARDAFDLLKNHAEKFKIFMQTCTCEHVRSKMGNKIKDLLIMAQQNNSDKPGKIVHYETRDGYALNKLRLVDLEEWVGKDSIDYLCEYYNII